MTSFKNSEPSENCPTCGGALVWRPAERSPVKLQIAFGLSFVLFLLAPQIFTKLGASFTAPLAWGWTLIQVGLGFALMRARRRASQLAPICVRCAAGR